MERRTLSPMPRPVWVQLPELMLPATFLLWQQKKQVIQRPVFSPDDDDYVDECDGLSEGQSSRVTPPTQRCSIHRLPKGNHPIEQYVPLQ